MQAWMKKATTIAEQVYQDFFVQVIKAGVLNDRCSIKDEWGKELSEKGHNPQIVRLMSISGKGGGNRNKSYHNYYNVTLLDHLLSVTRGSLMLASLDWLSRNSDMEEDFLRRKLYVMAVVAFMHDIDKDLSEPRIKDINAVTDEQVAERMTRYRIHEFLATVDVRLTPAQLLYLIDKVESQQANRRLPEEMPPRYTDGTLPLYVRLADKLDGIWLSAAKTGDSGIDGVLDRLKRDRSCIRSDLLREVFVIDLFDPHHPFLMDELQRRLSVFCQRETGAPPLFEIHHDGRLVMLMLANQQQFDKLKTEAVQDLCDNLPFRLELFISKRKELYLLNYLFNEKVTHTRLTEFIAKLKSEQLQQLFFIKTADKSILTEALEHSDWLDDLGLSPIFPQKTPGQTMTLYASLENMTEKAKQRVRKAAHAILLFNLSLKTKPKDGIPNYDDREQEFLSAIPEPRPNWINQITGKTYHGHPRRVLTALWALSIAADNKEVDNAIWGEKGLLKQWLEGTEERNGFNQFISADDVIEAVNHHLNQLFSGKPVTVPDESAQGRCLFTDQPIDWRLDENRGLRQIGIKVSAFSGRYGRPEDFDDDGHTNLSPVSMAEYKLRLDIYQNSTQPKKELDAAILISSPTTIGLFGGLAMDSDQEMQVMSLQQLGNLSVKDNMIDMKHYQGRYRLARFESMPGRLFFKNKNEELGQIIVLRLILQAALRTGRPFHIFRGLPVANRAFFYYDAMPPLLAELLSDGQANGNALRLEQIPAAIHRLEMAKVLLDTWGYGYQALQLYANPNTRFKGICFAWDGLAEKPIAGRLKQEYQTYFNGGELTMTEEDGVMVKLAREAKKIQVSPSPDSHSEQLMVIETCFYGLKQALKIPQPQIDDASLIHGIAGLLEETLKRRNLNVEYKFERAFINACVQVATVFVKEFWMGVMNKRFPSQNNQRFLKSVYRMSFMYRPKKHSE
jgi:hypothetical protein